MTVATAAPYYVERITYAVRMEGHFVGTPMVCISLIDPDEPSPEGTAERTAIVVMTASEVAETALQMLAKSFRRCGVAHNEPYPARGAWAYLGGSGVVIAELHAVVAALQDIGFYVALETSPHATNYIDAGLDWVCIAANAMGNNPDAEAVAIGYADELRFFIYRPQDIDFALAFVKEYPPTQGQPRTVSVQAVGQLNQAAQAECINNALAWGWRVSFVPYPDPTEPKIIRLNRADAASIHERLTGSKPRMLQ